MAQGPAGSPFALQQVWLEKYVSPFMQNIAKVCYETSCCTLVECILSVEQVLFNACTINHLLERALHIHIVVLRDSGRDFDVASHHLGGLQ